jgi:hypothetical protein
MAVLTWKGEHPGKDWARQWKAEKKWVQTTKIDGHEIVIIRRTFRSGIWIDHCDGRRYPEDTDVRIDVSKYGTEMLADGILQMSDAEINEFNQAIIEAKWALGLVKEPEDPIRFGRDLIGLMKSWLTYYMNEEEERPLDFLGPEFKGMTISDMVKELDDQTPRAIKFVESWTRIFFSFTYEEPEVD